MTTKNKRLLKGVGRVLVGVLLFNALGPLSVFAQDKGYVSPAAQRQLQQMAAWNQKLEQGKAEKALSPADRVSRDFKQAQDLVHSLKADSGARQPTASKRASEPASETRAVGPNVRIDVQRSGAMRLSDDRRTEQQARLKEHLKSIHDSQDSARADFTATGKELQAKKLPAEILARQSEAVSQFESRAAEFERLSQAWLNSKDGTGSDQALAQLDEFFKRYPAQRAAAPFDPKKLPRSTPKPTTREPATTKTAWFQQLWSDRDVRLAQAGNVGPINFQIPPEPGQSPTEDDLASTEDAQISQLIRDQATALGNNPVAILRWVHNTIEWVPSWGSIQGAESTLVMRRGNSMDIASATIALLRAAGVPARYVVGTVEVDANRFTNWIGGADNVQIAQNLLQQGGVATVGVVSGGSITKVRMEHAWVRAYANWAPSRGAKQGSTTQHVNPNGPLNAWIDIDPSYKQYTFSAPLDIAAAVPLDIAAVRSAATAGAVIDTTQGFVAGISETAVGDQLRSYGTRVQTYLDSRPDLTLSDLVKTRQIVSDTAPMLAGLMPHRVLTSQVLAALPDSMRHAVVIKLYATSFDRSMDASALSYRVSLPSLSNRRLGVTYEPASATDKQAIDSAVASGATSLPAYLINVHPAIQIDGATVAAGDALRMGGEQYWTVSFVDPSGSNAGDTNFSNTAGDEIVFGLNGNGITAEMAAKRYVEGSPATAAGNLEQAALLYWVEHDLFDQMAANATKVMAMRMPSIIEFAAPLNVHYFYGIARSGSYQSISGDGGRVLEAAAGKDDTARRNFMLMAGMQGSAIEGSVLDQLYSRPEETSVSTTQFFAIAMRQGVKLYSVTADNIGTVLPQITTSQSVKDDIANAVAAGMVAFVPERDIVNKSYTGIGYLLLDPQTGAGAYLIDGGRNGLNMPLCSSSALAPGGFLTIQALFKAEETTKAITGLVDTAADTPAVQKAKQALYKEVVQILKFRAEQILKRLGVRMLAALLVPGVNVAIGIALAVATSVEIVMVVIEIKQALADSELQTISRTEEDARCKCEKTPDDPACACKKAPELRSPRPTAKPSSEWTGYDRRVDWHHRCADNSGTSYPGKDVRLFDKSGVNISVDVFDNSRNLACEVKTSFKDEPYDPYIREKWLRSIRVQMTQQKRIAESCNWTHCVIVNKPWMKELIEEIVLEDGGRFRVENVQPNCASALPPSTPEPEIPDTPLDVE